MAILISLVHVKGWPISPTNNQFHSPEYQHVDVRNTSIRRYRRNYLRFFNSNPSRFGLASVREQLSCLLEMENIQLFSTSQLLKCIARCPHLPHHTLTNYELIIFRDMEKQTPFQPRIWDLFRTTIYQMVG